jgi:molybdenum cofactor cytidylyltransferase
MKLRQAFNIARGDVVSLIGAGGKTATLVSLAHELADEGWRVLATTTVRVDAELLDLMPSTLHARANAEAISGALGDSRFVYLYDSIRGGKVNGLSPSRIRWLLDSVDSDVLLIEADSAGGLPLKAPYADEPTLVPESTLVVPVASLTALGQPLNNESIYNAQAMIERYGFYEESPVKSPWVAQVLRDEELGLRGVPPKARVIAWLNATPATGYLRGRARLIARLILRSPRVYGVALGSARSADPVCEVQRSVGAVVLAAGMSRRMGQAKVLLPWSGNKSILEHILGQLILARLDHITVVTGHYSAEVKAVAERSGVASVHNPKYQTGEMLSSLKAGLKAMPDHIAAVLIVLGDQPRIQPKVISQVLTAYAEGAGDIIAPSYQMRRGHPILIDRRYWNEIFDLPNDGAPRDVINAHPERVHYVKVDNDSVLRDVDTPEDYAEERARAGLK